MNLPRPPATTSAKLGLDGVADSAGNKTADSAECTEVNGVKPDVCATVDVNNKPQAQDYTLDLKGKETATYDMNTLISDRETSDDNLQIIVFNSPAHGGLTWSDNTFTYEVTDGTGYVGNDAFTYIVKDKGNLKSEVKTVTLNNIADF